VREVIDGSSRWSVSLGDCIAGMHDAADEFGAFADFAIFSPPFPTLYAYTDSGKDLGNVDAVGAESKLHFSYFMRALVRCVKPGRVVLLHCMPIPRMKRSGEEGMCDFPGVLSRLAERAGFVFEYEWTIRKNPQAQAIRTRSRELQFAGLESDRARTRGAIPDHLLKFRVPGVNAVPIQSKHQVSRNDWINWAENCWADIKETETLQVSGTKGENDTRHICPLQLSVIRRGIRLFSNPDEIVLSPFTGIGSEGYAALGEGRRFVGWELKPEYHERACRELAAKEKTEAEAESTSLFAG
jgi:hypothetical protein